MTPGFLIFRLEGVMSGFGDPAVGERRPAAAAPGKSSILGLVGAALGLRRDEAAAHLALHEALGYGVRLDRSGAPLRDFHTTQAPLKAAATRRAELRMAPLATVLSDREYRTDAAFTVALWRRGSAGPTLEALAAALARPRYALCLGRRSCPLGAPPRPRVVSGSGLAAALAAYDRLEPDQHRPTPDAVPWTLWADADVPAPGGSILERRLRRDGLWNRAAWLFRDRLEVRLAGAAP